MLWCGIQHTRKLLQREFSRLRLGILVPRARGRQNPRWRCDLQAAAKGDATPQSSA